MTSPRRTHGIAALAGSAIVLVLLSGCGILEPRPVPSPTPTIDTVDPGSLIGGTIAPEGTTWTGTDSGGDVTTLTLHPGGTVAVSYGDHSYDYPGDTWWVRDGILRLAVYLDDTNGEAQYVATWDAATQTLSAVLRTTKTAKELTVTLSQVQ